MRHLVNSLAAGLARKAGLAETVSHDPYEATERRLAIDLGRAAAYPGRFDGSRWPALTGQAPGVT